MISNFFVLSPRGDTIIAKQYRTNELSGNSSTGGVGGGGDSTTTTKEMGAHERSHTEAFFRKIKFWDDNDPTTGLVTGGGHDNMGGFGSGSGSGGLMGGGGGGGGGGKDDGEPTMLLLQEASKRTGDAPPVFMMPDGLTYFHVKRNGLIFGACSARNVSPSNVLELLSTIARIFKDYCGTLSEEALRKNFILCYELLDEMIDYGYPQVIRTENLKSFVYNEPIVVDPSVQNTGNLVNPKTASASAVHKPVISSVHENGRKTNLNNNQKNEIFVDILERLNVLFSNNGYVLNSTIDGCIQMKSYLAGNPELRLALNEDLIIGKGSGHYGSSSNVIVDDMNFNDCVNLNEFEHARTLSFIPPDGEFVVLNYRITGEFPPPFRIFPSIEEVESKKLELTLLIRSEMPSNHFGANVIVELPMPVPAASTSSTSSSSSSFVANNQQPDLAAVATSSGGTVSQPPIVAGVSCNLITAPGTGYSNAEYLPAENKIIWTMKKFLGGGAEQTLRAKIIFNTPITTNIKRQIGPINMCFEIPMYNVSNLQVRYLRVAENMVGYTPYRWVRYVTQSSSYVCRL